MRTIFFDHIYISSAICAEGLHFSAFIPLAGLKQAVATINARGITGTIKFMAISFSETRIMVNLQGLTGEQAVCVRIRHKQLSTGVVFESESVIWEN